MAQVFKVAAIPGDGIGTEVTEAAIQVLEKLASVVGSFRFEWTHYEWNSKRYLEQGSYMPKDFKEQLCQFHSILYGSCGWPDVPDHISLWELMLPLRNSLNQYVNVRPSRMLKGVVSPLSQVERKPSDLDWVIIRENSEGEYAGHGGTTHGHTEHAVATEVAIFTRTGIERISRFAFETARSRPRKKLTMVTKSNAQRHGMVLWDKVFYEVAKEYPDVEHDKMLVDAMTVRMVNNPQSLDTIVATNLHADILTDLAAALSGSIGIAPSSNLDPTRKCPSMFEPIHGSAPDIAGKGIANPIGSFWSAAEMVRWLGKGELDSVADKFIDAIENVIESGIKTRDLKGTANTKEVTEAVCVELEKVLKK